MIRGSDDEGRPAGRPTYGLETPRLPSPDLPGEVVVAATADELIDRLAADLVVHAENCVRRFGDFQLALSSGAALQRLYDRLMYDPNYRRLPWRRTHLWQVAETGASPRDWTQLDETLVDHADIPRDQVHPIDLAAPTADRDYEAALRESLAWREKGHDRLDFVLLLLDERGAVAGFDAPPSGTGDERLVRGTAPRVAMTETLINAARFVAVLATGSGRAEAVRAIADGADAGPPAARVRPLEGELRWYLDADAGSAADDDTDA